MVTMPKSRGRRRKEQIDANGETDGAAEEKKDDGASNQGDNSLVNPGGGDPSEAPSRAERHRHGEPVRSDAAGPSQDPNANAMTNKEENVLLNPGSGDPAENLPSRRNYTVSQVPVPPYTKLGNPGPLGLLSFALTTFALGLYECGAGLPHSNPHSGPGPNQAIVGLALFFGGTAQFVAGILEWRVGNTFGCTVHCSYAAFWFSYSMFLIPYIGIKQAYKGDKTAYTFAIGIFLILWCFLTILFFIAALRTNLTILAVFFFLAIAFLLLSVGEFTTTLSPDASIRLTKAGGAFTVVSAFCAFYGGASGLMVKDTTFVRFPLGEIPISTRASSV